MHRWWRWMLVAVAAVGAAFLVWFATLGPGGGATTPARPSRIPSASPSGDRLRIQRISADPLTGSGSQHATEVEPDTFAFGDVVVATFQVGRFDRGGGAASIGFATSADRGETWTDGLLPGLTVSSTPPGPASRASDPSVAYDSVHRVWLIASLRCPAPPKRCGGGPTELVASRSGDGLTWSAPVLVSAGDYDKSWVVCDKGTASRFRGTCYAMWTDVRKKRTLASASVDGGITWGSPTHGHRLLGVQPVVQPNGALVITGEDEEARTILAIRSTDGARTFDPPVVIAHFARSNRRGFRIEQLPSSEVDGAGTVYVAWEDCRFVEDCKAHDIVFSSSTDGRDWSPPGRIPRRGPNAGEDAVLPGLGVDPATSGPTARLGVTFYSFVHVPCAPADCRLHVGFVSSGDGGKTWTDVVSLSSEPFELRWLPRTNLGRMAGDYISTSFVRGRAVTVYPLAFAPAPAFDEPMFAATIPV